MIYGELRKMAKFGKRTLNKAQTRLDILAAVYQLSNSCNFRDLKVKSLVEKAQITEMTFFNYFKKKEDILRYMMGIWALDQMVAQFQKPLFGEAAIRRIFSLTVEHVKKHPGLLVSFISYLVTNEIAPTAADIEPADRYLLYPNEPKILEANIMSGNEMILQHLNEMDPAKEHTHNLFHLASCFYGDVLIAHTGNIDLEMLYTNSLDLIFKNVSATI